jgi:hypothetical protein
MNFKNHNFSNYTTRALGMIVQDGINRAYEHYFFQNAQRELSKRLRKRNKLKNI